MGRRSYATHPFSLLFTVIEKLYIKSFFLLHQEQVLTLQESRLKTPSSHWKIDKLIVEYEHQQITGDEDHQEFLSQLSERLIKKFGKIVAFLTLEENCKFCLVYFSFSKKNVLNERADILQFQFLFTWERYQLLIHLCCLKNINFYKKNPAPVNWAHSLLEKLTKNRLFERFFANINKESVLRSGQQGSLGLFAENNNY